jgi:hypothetical protein
MRIAGETQGPSTSLGMTDSFRGSALAGTLASLFQRQRRLISTSEALASTFVIDGGGLECPLYRNKCQASRYCSQRAHLQGMSG